MIEVTGSSFQGYVMATRAQLEKVLQDRGNGDKWNYDFVGEIDGILVTAYDWKNDMPIEHDEIFQWNVGGFIKDAVTVLEKAVRNA
jgi:hypothetical protein